MTPKEFRKEIKLRFLANAYQNLTTNEKKLYRVGFKSGYRLAKNYFFNKKVYAAENNTVRYSTRFIKINDMVVPTNVKRIIEIVSNQLGIDATDIVRKTRVQSAVIGRSLVINILRDKFKMDVSKIGMIVGHRDHTTVIHHLRMKLNKKHFWQKDYAIWNKYNYIMDSVK